MNNETMKEMLKQSVADYRYKHAIGTAETAAELASWHNIDTNSAWIAGLLHYCAKFDDNPKTFLDMEKKAGITPTQNQMTDPCLFLHALLSAYIAERDYKIKDSKY
jgi:nicotinate-nucleotide adenylyltransferase